MKLVLGEEHVVVRGIRPEEKLWGPYQFPLPFRMEDRLVVSVHTEDDTIVASGNPTRWFESFDGGKTWRQREAQKAAECGLRLPNGDRLYFPVMGGINLKHYSFPDYSMLTPGYDFTKRAAEGTMPIQDGVTAWWTGDVIRAYNADRLPESLGRKEWTAQRIPAGSNDAVTEKVPVDWPYLTRVVFDRPGGNMMKPINPRGVARLGPDGRVYITAFSGEGHLNPENGWYSPYYSAELFCSDDNGHSFYQLAHMEYEADGKRYPYQSGGFSDSDIAFMDDGSMLWFMRSAWMASTGYEWAPMYWARSTDGGKTWTRPEVFAKTGILPRLCKLKCGATLLCYARPGIFVQACRSDDPERWTEPLVVMTPDDRSGLANVKIDTPSFHEWDGACNNPELLPLDDNRALLFYSDFYYPDADGTKRKTILCREISVEDMQRPAR